MTSVNNYKFYILLSFIILLFFELIYLHNNEKYGKEKTHYYINGGDTGEYMSYANNVLAKGEYVNDKGEHVSRMPAYSFTLLLFRSFTDENTSKTLVCILQIVLASICMYLLPFIAYRITDSTRIFYGVYFLYGFQQVTKIFDLFILTESLANSMLIITAFFLVKFYFDAKNKYLFYAGLAFVYCFFLRPFVLPLLLFFILLISIRLYQQKISLKKIFVSLFIFLLPFGVFESLWVARNYIQFKEVILTQVGLYAGMNQVNSDPKDAAYVTIWSWINAVGGNAVWWDQNSMGAYLIGRDSSFIPAKFEFPAYVLTSNYTVNDIENAHHLYADLVRSNDKQVRDSISKIVVSKFSTFENQYKAEHPFQYHIGSRLRIFKHTFFHSGAVIPVKSFPEIKNAYFELGLKLASILFYYIMLVFGVIGMLYIFISQRKMTILLMALIPFAVICIVNFGLRSTEFRLYNLIFPYLTFCAVFLLDKFYEIIQKRFRKV